MLLTSFSLLTIKGLDGAKPLMQPTAYSYKNHLQ
jgi:hypothetical protein